MERAARELKIHRTRIPRILWRRRLVSLRHRGLQPHLLWTIGSSSVDCVSFFWLSRLSAQGFRILISERLLLVYSSYFWNSGVFWVLKVFSFSFAFVPLGLLEYAC